MKSQFLMTTSPSFDGLEIEGYLGIVTSNVVTGTGIFSDIAASFSDFFGGRSNSYKKQLDSIREEAIREIESKARTLGANAVVGLSIDNDQVSGKNSQMLMISVTATAVRLKPLKHDVSGFEIANSESSMTYEEVILRYQIHKFKSSKEELTLEQIFHKYNELFNSPPTLELARVLIQRYFELPSTPSNNDTGLKQFLTYLSLFPSGDLKQVVFDEITQLDDPQSAIDLISLLARNFDVYDNLLIMRLLEMEDIHLANCGLAMCLSKPSIFKRSDIKQIESIISKIEHNFPIKREIQEQKRMIGKVRVWECANKHENDEAITACSHCDLSRRDTWKNTYDDALRKLKGHAYSLKIAFPEQTTEQSIN